ncbi:hypothetical protein LCGC14_2643300 [marine sediment metagenome]|uniref:Uncharacterized protein n=1 Tax=marine sediment metagenome TaxID=412755 RepID=A0A0F8ZX49_9ZZZZ
MDKDTLAEFVKDLKRIRNAVYTIADATNPRERTVWTKHAYEVAHNVTEKYKNLLIKVLREEK